MIKQICAIDVSRNVATKVGEIKDEKVKNEINSKIKDLLIYKNLLGKGTS